jgi:hypothetical protein
MLIINILLILLFLIILLYEVNIIEGQEENNEEKSNNFYNYNNLLTDYDTILDKIDLSSYLGFNIKNYMEKYNSKCSDDDKGISIPKNISNKLMNNDNTVNTNESILNKNKVNNLLGYFNIEIDNSHTHIKNNNNENNDDNNDSDVNVCSLVNHIYEVNNNMSDTLISDITNKYGNCFVTNNDDNINIFQNNCEQSCYLQEEQLEICNEYSIDGIENCKDYSKIPGNILNDIYIKKNGIYYNCSKINNDNNIGVIEYSEIPCIPKNNICTDHNMGFLKKCEDHNASMEFPCEDYHISENGNYYNCISDDTKFNEQTKSHSCVKSIKGKYSKPCIKEQIINYNECKQTY